MSSIPDRVTGQGANLLSCIQRRNRRGEGSGAECPPTILTGNFFADISGN